MNQEEAFEEWHEEYFCNQQGEDSPYSYNDVKIAFLKGWKCKLNQIKEQEKNK